MGEEHINEKKKDRLFSFIFGKDENRKWTLSLYNAVNGSNYTDADDIEFTTMSDTVYMRMKNDVSFIFQSTLSLYEHQSTFNPNMPVRGLMYLGRLYDKYIRLHRLNIYGTRRILLPLPKLVTFYNGTRDMPDDQILKLSDAYSPTPGRTVEPDVEVCIRMININYGHNEELLKECRPLMEYSWFIDRVRSNKKSMEMDEAVDAALMEMPSDFMIKPFLEGNQSEVKNMCITEYNEAETMELFREEGIEQGREQEREEGLVRLIAVVQRKVAKSKELKEIADDLETDEAEIRPLYDAVLKCGAEAPAEEVLKILKDEQNVTVHPSAT